MTDVSLRDYFERLLEERDRAHVAQLTSAQRAVEAAAETLKARLEHMNEFRAQITEERALYVRRDHLEPIVVRLIDLEKHRANLDGRFWALGVALGVLTTALHFWLRG